VLVCVDCDRTLLTRYPVSVIMVVFRLGGRLYTRGEWVLEGEYHGAIFPFYEMVIWEQDRSLPTRP
jgi:hypothetical protein